MKIVIVIPTYNEALNIGRLIDSLNEVFKLKPDEDFHILIVDANSPDGTAGVVKQKMDTFGNVHILIEEKKAGLGAAYIAAFKYALQNLSPDVIMEMDADFQHNPDDLMKIVNEIQNGNDYVIGSRFTEGGSIPKDWALYRKILSYGGNLFTKLVLGIYQVNDFTSGFKASRVKNFVDRIDLVSVLSGGFAYKIDLLFKMYKLGAKIKEVPITFGLRDRGDSKMERNNFIDSLRVVLSIRYNENSSFFKFALVGFVGLFVDGGLFNILRLTPLRSSLATPVSGFIAMMTTYLLNNYWSFSDRKIDSINKKLVGFIVYVISSTIPILVRSKLVIIATSAFGDTFFVSNTAFFIGIVFGLVWNFLVYSKIIWRKR
ncbi:hypothetical protein A3F07_00735 [candidate division WWE3 bacterium RIFCSPHIGHO2_12_FULL_38_15]|uniref:Dolichyl-phosphate beta-D-mannosyltransferase n=1 Tax=candidate division WWE3 bacterium RIFCSPHIGHO2_02_FULL_38_14 TaxID=1802620 RepID=A0A1F4VBG5_UNCKA|nr:MAG: hypothetical protein A2793_00820 [candidate division WWE3 bacterium RIFCSPHIGHO2_01_FULL_38_45]OGC49100.1 MAG: hypothetical protein A3F07_00735 [candidate division WWE3 bacterium RIFCSPHIGHO2_12_FULL_38_15]OGC53555.1 MAG: hypothetical protein A3B64_04370 [candidate division WWE3 bacterium RIFCSPLOWO2_01_FULL_37_24]OGC54459.1 MAG: hypothetical protein A3D91_01000 [candidate division WWE3 bacterium RIFCSPHIGHO2_02_FULL_38_14]HLB51705.1 glycosyltransferase family 2 protein [Patescibacteria